MLRRLTLADAPNVASQINDDRVLKWLRDSVPNPYHLADAEFFIREVAPKNEVFGVFERGIFVGVVGGHFLSDVHACTMEVGYWFGVSHWGHGLATTSTALLCDYVERVYPDIHRLEAYVYEGNAGSCRVLEKCGFALESVRKKRVVKQGRVLDEYAYARVR